MINPWNIVIGNNTMVNEYCLLDGRGGLVIGDNCSISMYAILYTASHRADSETFEYYKASTTVRDNVWIGTRAIILAGSEINENCIIGANSVLCSKKCKKNGIYVGAPAKLVRERNVAQMEKQTISIYFR